MAAYKYETDHRIYHLEEKVADLKAKQSVLNFDFYYSNREERISVPADGSFLTLDPPGKFCVEKGDTIAIQVSLNLDTRNPIGGGE